MSVEELEPLWKNFIRILKSEVKPALGCTEPVSLALAAATAAFYLNKKVEMVEAWVSPNLMKNGMGVTIPGTGMVGLPVAAALGVTGGNASAGLEVLKEVTSDDIIDAKKMLEHGKVHVNLAENSEEAIYARAIVSSADDWVSVTISGEHTRIVEINCQGEIIYFLNEEAPDGNDVPDVILSQSSLREIVYFAENCPFSDISFILEAARLNDALSREGLSGKWGMHIGATLQKQYAVGFMAKNVLSEMIIRTTAASDARMGGAMLPAMSNYGSGNQGITATMPVVVMSDVLNSDEEQLARALILSHLAAIYIHSKYPRLSALCAANTAAMGAAAGIAWLIDGRYETIAMAVSSMVGDVSGVICDGASDSCAMKVSTAVSSAWKAVMLALDNTTVSASDGIVTDDVEQTILNLCALASRSMKQTDIQIIDIMSKKQIY
ncbi:serine dehydratase subunit alpha family protein [Citrobacter sp. CtB7.12]|uniref:L-cysteine desulfidase family protein n=1 Tax=Citrobacter sp. CtB7.12 TaxID=1696093 RepID=UPI0006BA3881|nr:L-serine ammonia-lyase, iron-sulfur-dependent, subunit alpha [Citrobacter sp. CtB7.12]